ncbi:hypothetical protein P280DRAFT_217871 [Massarina eburnea CBS 473.64]|uniref:GATA-type domain-containing protein n=1 Tax=Massarina eburnea CBS 473.64 TaxID=1395130 RepID=A0A6A6S9A1_9PLEO|nr:hypothetical protein P280DRAFT_217871 [Massarina eburnea CBS 473.64]
MEALDARQSSSFGLPSISNLDSVKREEMERKRSYPFPAPNLSVPASAAAGPLGGLLSPPESRRTSGDDEKEQQRPRQSLPSIHELAFAPTAPPPPAPASASQPHFQPPTTSPVDHRTRPSFPSDLHGSQGPGNPFSHPRSPYTSASTVPPPPPPQAQPDSLPRPPYAEPRPSFSDPRPSLSERHSFPAPQHNPKLPTLHPLQTTQSPPPGPSRPNPPYSSYSAHPSAHPSGAYETQAPHSAGPMNHSYGYSQYPSSNYPLSAPAPGAPNSAYPPSTYSAPPRPYPNPPSWPEHRLEEKKINRSSLAPYGESVKRHLESFDLEASLNEMADGAVHITEFSDHYRRQAHSTQRIGMGAQSVPGLDEVDRMLKHSEKIQISLQRMREVIFNNQQASMVEAPQDPRHRPMNGYDHEMSSNYGEDLKGGGGFAGAENKKRRGPSQRAAPPGRCHSCNRAETPEWRRGPDGARTLCNACGLHYAKLTRKMGGKQAMAGSNLRPKSLDQGSTTG